LDQGQTLSKHKKAAMNRYARLIVLTCLTFLTATTTSAATRDEQTQACSGDAMRLCSAEIPNEDKITACMKQHISQLSPGCKAMFHQSRQSTAASRKTRQQ
jgi:hypothetical protein